MVYLPKYFSVSEIRSFRFDLLYPSIFVRDMLRDDKQFAPSSEKAQLVCDECGYSTKIKNKLIDHVNGVHLEMNGLMQPLCQF